MTRRIWSLAVVLLLSLLVATSFSEIFSNANKNSASSSDRPPIVIGYSNWAGWWPWAIAESEGLFAKRGVKVELKWYDDYTQSLENLAAGTIDGNCQTLNDTISFADSAAKGEVVVLVNDNSSGNDKIIADASINELEDLKNKDVVLEAGVVNDFLLSLALEKEGMKRSDINIIDIETGAAAAAFAAGHANAVGVFPPFWLTALEREGAHEIVSSSAFPGAIPDLLVLTTKLVDERPEEVQALVNTWFDILEFMEKNPESADRIMANRAEVSLDQLKLFKSGVEMFDLQQNIEAFDEGDEMKNLPHAASEISDFLQYNFNSFDSLPRLSRLFDSRFVRAYSSLTAF